MSEETNIQSDPVDQESAISSYLESYKLVDDEPDANDDKKDADIETTPKKEVKKDVTEEPDPKSVQEPEKKPVTVKTLKDIPQDFTGKFFTKGESGEIIYNRDKAMDFLLPEPGKPRFDYDINNRIKFIEEKNAEAEPEDEYQKFVKEEKTYRTNVKTNMRLGLSKFGEYFQQNGGNAQEAFRRALEDVDNMVNTDFEERDYQNQANWQKRLEEKFGVKQNDEKTKSAARSNEALLMNEISTHFGLNPNEARDSYVSLMKQVFPIMRYIFEMTNPELSKGVSTRKYDEMFSNWWIKTASNNDYLRFIYGLVKNDLNAQLDPYTNESYHMARNKAKAESQKSRGARPSPVSRSSARPTSDAVKEVQSYFGYGNRDVSVV